jgi:dolichyl-phosphate-mannose-protein mannosyltransferase
MRKKFFFCLSLIFLISLSFFTRFFHLSFPPKVVFDEAHFGLYATKYLSHQYFFDIHPPFGKLILGFVAFLTKSQPGFDFEKRAEYGTFKFIYLRGTIAFFGSLFVILIYFLVRELGFSKKAAFLASFFVLFDNAFLVQSRLILIDIFLLFFIFLSLYLYLIFKKLNLFSKKWWIFGILLGLSLGAAISVKLIGFGILILIWLWEILEEKFFLKEKKEIFAKIFLLFTLPIFLYFLFFCIHFSLAWQKCEKNCGWVLDWERIWPGIEKLPDYATLSFWILKMDTPPVGNLFNKFLEVHKLMFYNFASVSEYYWQSPWYSWPFMIRPIGYFSEKVDGKMSYICFFGNPLVWWISFLGILIYLYLVTRNLILKFKMNLPSSFYSPNLRLLFLGYTIFFFGFSIVPRFLLLYHYLSALTFSIIISSVLFSEILKKLSKKLSNILFFGILCLIFLSFLYFSPLTYGFPISEKSLKQRAWLSSWFY